MNTPLDYRIQLDAVSEGFDGKMEWFQPRAGVIPPRSAVLTMTKAWLGGSDVFFALHSLHSDDLGRTWSTPVEHRKTLGRKKEPGGSEVVICDADPVWHAATGKLLAIGHTARYVGDRLMPDPRRRETAYTVYLPETRTWMPWRVLDIPDMEDRFFSCGAGCTQRVDLENGDILLPVSFLPRTLAVDSWHNCFRATVVRCRFDGRTLGYLEHGDEMSVPDPRGLDEPSLTLYRDVFYLTLRNDLRGYVTRGTDGLQFEPPVPWRFDDGVELGSYNTQQHWVTHSEGLFLAYTRRGAGNDHVFRHRAPLFLAQVDPDRLCILRRTERILVPDHGAQLGNFGTANASREGSWVVTSEGMQDDSRNPDDIERTVRRGADNRVYLCRLQWNRPNELVTRKGRISRRMPRAESSIECPEATLSDTSVPGDTERPRSPNRSGCFLPESSPVAHPIFSHCGTEAGAVC